LLGPKGSDEIRELVHGLLEAVVHDHVLPLVLGRQLALGHRQPAGDLLLVLGAAADQACSQRVERGRLDEHLHRLGERLAHLARALQLDLEHEPILGPLELGTQRAVAVAGVLRVFEELPVPQSSLELLR
jgi:hypothetical protein